MNFEQCSHGNSFLHHSDPRVKIIAAAFLSLILALSQDINTALTGLLLALFFIMATRISAHSLFKRFFLVNSFNIALWILLPLTYGQQPFINLFGVHISTAGLHMAALITLKSNAILLLFVSLLSTSTVNSLGHALQELHLSPRLCMLLLFAYRYIFVLYREYLRLYRAARLRCFTARTNLHTYKTYAHLLGMLLVKSWNRAARIQTAMELRGFTGTFHNLHELKMEKNDFLLLAVSLGCGIILLVI